MISFQEGNREGISRLQGQVMPFPDGTRQVDDSLHPLHLTFNVFVEILLLRFRQAQEVYRARIRHSRIFRDELPEALVQILRNEWGI
jgi:hypothetical protein